MDFEGSGKVAAAVESHPPGDLFNRCFSLLAQMLGCSAEPHVVKEAYRSGAKGCLKTFGEH